jgi:hypothetical protein
MIKVLNFGVLAEYITMNIGSQNLIRLLYSFHYMIREMLTIK